MRTAKLRLLAAAVLFACWIGWLVYLAAATTGEPVLSRPQFLVSNLYVIAELKADGDHPAAEVVVHQVIWSANPKDRERKDGRLTIANLTDCGAGTGWAGPGDYILPLLKRTDPAKGDSYLVTPTPRSPGFRPDAQGRSALRIYPATRQALAQAEQIRETYGKELGGE
jgi:hypothetical protein